MNFLESRELVLVLAVVTIGLLVFNSFAMVGVNSSISQQGKMIKFMQSSASLTQATSSGSTESSSASVLSFEEFLPKGVPAVYGAQLGVSFDDPIGSLDIMAALDGDLYPNGLLHFADLSEQEQQDYILIGQSISCEFCCSADYVVAANGQPACGCAHSAAMRGLTMYILQNHRGEMTNEQILEQLTMWKVMFFPKQMYQRALELQSAGTSQSYDVLDEIPDMVGGC